MSTSNTIRQKPVTKGYKAGHELAYGRKCRGCRGSMRGEPADAVWCRECKRREP